MRRVQTHQVSGEAQGTGLVGTAIRLLGDGRGERVPEVLAGEDGVDPVREPGGQRVAATSQDVGGHTELGQRGLGSLSVRDALGGVQRDGVPHRLDAFLLHPVVP